MFNKKPESTSQLADRAADTKAQINEPKKPEISIDMKDMEVSKAKASNSIIDEWLTMTGDLESEGDILIRGKVRGNIKCKLLIIDEKASVDGGMVAEEVVVRGTTKGTIRANRVIFEETAHVDSEIYHRSFAVEEGARIKGALHFTDDPMVEGTSKTTVAGRSKSNGAGEGAPAAV